MCVCADTKWGDDGGLAHSDSKLASGHGHKSTSSASALPAILTKGSHGSLGESGKHSMQHAHTHTHTHDMQQARHTTLHSWYTVFRASLMFNSHNFLVTKKQNFPGLS